MNARHPMQDTLDKAHAERQAARFDAAPLARWPIATEHLQRGVPGLRYPRTLGEAFPDTADYACALEGPRPGPGGEWWLYAACAVLGLTGAAAGLSVAGWLAGLVAVAAAAWKLSRSST